MPRQAPVAALAEATEMVATKVPRGNVEVTSVQVFPPSEVWSSKGSKERSIPPAQPSFPILSKAIKEAPEEVHFVSKLYPPSVVQNRCAPSSPSATTQPCVAFEKAMELK